MTRNQAMVRDFLLRGTTSNRETQSNDAVLQRWTDLIILDLMLPGETSCDLPPLRVSDPSVLMLKAKTTNRSGSARNGPETISQPSVRELLAAPRLMRRTQHTRPQTRTGRYSFEPSYRIDARGSAWRTNASP